jgi:hypothetical protein
MGLVYVRTMVVAALLGFGAAACDGDHPNGPAPTLNVGGAWTGTVPASPPGSDWSTVDMTLQQSARSLSGRATGRDGTPWDLAGGVGELDGDAWSVQLSVQGLPGTSTCATFFLFAGPVDHQQGAVAVLEGMISGRCYGTLAGTFRFTRK